MKKVKGPIASLSASRIKTKDSCSWLYWCKYKLKLPDAKNLGATKGSICHNVFEVLSNPRHRKSFELAIKEDSIFASPSLSRYVKLMCAKEGLFEEEVYEEIDTMCMRGLAHDFFGASKEEFQTFAEQKFDITVTEDGKCYKILGFIDKIFYYPQSKTVYFRDFKTSKEVFKGKDAADNIQYAIYSLAAKKLFPEAEKIAGEFLFIRFPSNSAEFCLKVKPISMEEIEGLEYELTETQESIDSFSEEDAINNMAGKKDFPTDGSFSGPLMCGFAKFPGQLKKDGNPMWHCAFKFAYNYYTVTKKGKTPKEDKITNISEDEYISREFTDDETVEKKRYLGCPRWNGGQITT